MYTSHALVVKPSRTEPPSSSTVHICYQSKHIPLNLHSTWIPLDLHAPYLDLFASTFTKHNCSQHLASVEDHVIGAIQDLQWTNNTVVLALSSILHKIWDIGFLTVQKPLP
eukprot:m.63764 g.63764  ORF g.63764 m.63764 type:complete len:111 (-) comp11964_c1_seq1:1520-1852(-)